MHATVRIGEYVIPLIGIPEEASLEKCDLCHDDIALADAVFDGKHVYCKQCLYEANYTPEKG